MTSCFSTLILGALPIALLVSLIRWFEQVTDAVDHNDWAKVRMLLIVPLTVWAYPSKVSIGRPTMVPRHEPVRGFGKVPLTPSDIPKPPPKKKKSPIDPEMIAKLKQKMREQGMLEDRGEGRSDDDSDSQT